MKSRKKTGIVFIFSLVFFILFFQGERFADRRFIALAGTGQNVKGFAWSENFGWVSFNSRDCDIDGDGTFEGAGENGGSAPAGCPVSGAAVDYGVNINPAGDFSGFAWSENFGWLVFNRIKVCDIDATKTCASSADCLSGACNLINPPVAPYNGGSGIIAHYNSSNRQINGWAYVLALGNDGWLKLRKDPADSGVSYGASVKAVEGEFLGWGWNGNAAYGTGAGWLSFNCEDTGTCATAEYHVQAPIPEGLNITSIDQYAVDPCDSCSCLKINWVMDAQSQQDGFNVYENFGLIASALNPSIRSYLRNGLAPGTAYNYTVRAYNIFGYIEDSDVGTTKAVCRVSSDSLTGTGICPDTINLNWNIPGSACAITYYEVARCECADSSCSNCPESEAALSSYALLPSGGCYRPTVDQCSDDTFTDANNFKNFRYIVRAHCDDGDIDGEWSGASDRIKPCPKPPKWQER